MKNINILTSRAAAAFSLLTACTILEGNGKADWAGGEGGRRDGV